MKNNILQDAQMCEVLTLHITAKDEELLQKIELEGDFSVLIVYEKNGGHFVFVDDDLLQEESPQDQYDLKTALIDLGFSQHFIDLLRLAAKEGYWWMKLIRDEETSAPGMPRKILADARMCSVSTSHITWRDNELLLEINKMSDDFHDLVFYNKEDGYFVFVNRDIIQENVPKNQYNVKEALLRFGFGQQFIDLLCLAAKEGYWWILLDAQDTPTSGLPTFDW
jgi:hypothetical protein